MITTEKETIEINKTDFIIKNYEKIEKFYFWNSKDKDLKGTISLEEYKTRVLLDLCLLWECDFDFKSFQEQKQRDRIQQTINTINEFERELQEKGNTKYITITELSKITYKLRLQYTNMQNDLINITNKKEYKNNSLEYQDEEGDTQELEGVEIDFDYESINNQALIKLIRVATSEDNYKFILNYAGDKIEKSGANRKKYCVLIKQMQEKLKGMK